MKLPRHKTKVVCTIGPASRSESVLRKLIESGMNVARINFAHGSREEHRESIRRIRSLASEMGRVVAILADLPGPKIRIGRLKEEPVVLRKGETVTLTTKDLLGTSSLISVHYDGLTEGLRRGSLIYLNDGFIQLRVEDVQKNAVRCRVVIGGELLSHKGLNLPDLQAKGGAITREDESFVDFGLEEDVDAFSVSFVEEAADLIKVKEMARRKGKEVYVVAKIERKRAVKNIDEILRAADALMVARGDLGVEMPIEDVPAVQKKLIHKANLMGRPVITATQMLESMTGNIRPTRAEVTDVANAILDGTDAVMLSEETAVGLYPVEAAKMAVKIARSIERQRNAFSAGWNLPDFWQREFGNKRSTVEDTISLAVMKALQTLNIRLVLTPTRSGSTPRHICRFKPDRWVIAFTGDEKVRNFLALSYGVYPVLISNEQESLHEKMLDFVRDSGLAARGDKLILTEGIKPGLRGGTNSMKIITLT